MLKRILFPLSIFVFLLLLWEFSLKGSKDFLFVLPTPKAIIHAFFSNSKSLLYHGTSTLYEMIGGLLLALCASFPLAWMMYRFRSATTFLQPLFIVIQCLPMFTLAPIMVIWFGWSYTAIVVPTALMIFFPLTLCIYQGFCATPLALVEFFQTNGASAYQLLFKLQLPWSSSHIFSGLRIATAISGIGAIAGEWAGAQKGLGILMLESRRNTDLEITFAALITLTGLSFSFYMLVILVEKFFKAHKLRAKIRKSLTISRNGDFLKKLSFLLALTLLSSCEKKEEKSFKLMLDWLPNPNHVPLYYGIDRGLFQDEGIELSLQKTHESSGGISYLTAHRTDLLISYLPSTLRAKARGADIKILGILIKEPLDCLIYHKDLRVQKPSDLSGKKLGYCSDSPHTQSYLMALLDHANIQPSEKTNVGADLISTIATKRVDFIYGAYWNIEPYHLRSLHVETDYFKMTDFGAPPCYELVILANSDDARMTTDFVARFKRALQKSIDASKADPEKAFQSYLNNNLDKSLKTIAWEKEAWTNHTALFADDQTVSTELIEEFSTWMQGQIDFPYHIDCRELI